jgi:hypothetical protein
LLFDFAQGRLRFLRRRDRTTIVQSADFFGLLKRDAVFVDLFNRVFHTFCEELFFRVK